MSGCILWRLRTHSDVPQLINLFIWPTLTIMGAFIMLMVSSVDGLQGWRRHSRIFLVMTIALVCAIWFLYHEFSAPEYEIESDIFGTISIRGRVANTFEVLCIFLTKQAINTWLKGRHRCVAVRYCPYIEWQAQMSSTEAQHGFPVSSGSKTDCHTK